VADVIERTPALKAKAGIIGRRHGPRRGAGDTLPSYRPPSPALLAWLLHSRKAVFAMHLIWTIIIGFVAGLVARALMPGDNPMGFILTTLLGIAGSLVATYAGQAMGWYTAGTGAGFIASVVGALIVLFVYGLIARRT
jgi:uncharacterized membrane protein YeaQ/YmgE (transglycosylase-associated protein family)